MINGAHLIVYSKEPAADRAFFQDVLGLSHVDVGDGWLIFGLPPSEIAVHPSKKNGVHELYLMCEDVKAFVKAMKSEKIACDAVQDQGWGLLTSITLPGGGKLGVYEPRHARPGVKAKRGANGSAEATPARALRRGKTAAPARAKRSAKTATERRR